MITAELIVFDLDGTLADSLPDIAAAANFACRRLGLPEHSPAAIKQMIGGGEAVFLQRVLGPEHQGLFEEALNLYLQHYFRHCGDLTRLYPGVPETLQYFAEKKLAVLSNKLQQLSEKVLQVMGILPFFAAVRGGGGHQALKPSPEPLIALIREFGTAPQRAVMVGDKPADVVTARGASAHIVAVTYGYGDPATLQAASPDVLITEITQLRACVH